MQAVFNEVVRQFQLIGKEDPQQIEYEGQLAPRQLAESACIGDYVNQLEQSPSMALRLSVHCQHLRRFAYPRSEFPGGREGYLLWRREAARRSFAEAANVMRAAGVDATTIEEVRAIMTKFDRQHRRDVQIMEDALCLAFYRLDAVGFGAKHETDEVMRILRRTWTKMSVAARQLALKESFSPPVPELLRSIADESHRF
jgi:hypothetical protein